MCFTTCISTDWMRYVDRYDDCSLQVHLERDLVLWLPETDAVRRWNNWRHFRKMSFSLCLRGHCGLESHHTSASLSLALTYGCVFRGIAAAQLVSLCFENAVVENKQQQSSERTVKGLLPLEQSLHSEAKMGQSQTRPTEVPPVGALPPSPRTVCALRLAEPPHRYCCHYQHFSYPERAMSYSPPYSPSLFKRPDRR